MLRLLLIFLLLPLSAEASLYYQGETSLYQDTVWEGDVLIDGILTVAAGTTLEIRPGTRVRFTRYDSNADQIGEHEIFIQGRLIARGTAAEPIIFTSAEADPRPGDWGAINMVMSEENANLLEYCRVEYAYRGFHAHFARVELYHSRFRYNQRAAQFQESDVLLDDCRFENNFNGLQFRDSTVKLLRSRILNNNWGIRAVYVKLRLEDSLIAGNRINGVSLRDSEFFLLNNQLSGNRRGLYLQRSRGEARGNLISGNLEHGIYLEDSLADLISNRIVDNGRAGIKVRDAGGEVVNNQLRANHQFTLVNDGEDDFKVAENWYAASPRILDHNTRPTVGRITIAAPLQTPVVAPQ
ncbi:MAG: hypothetical protein GXP51_05830 [Deltaproteobacteria bacterium]|nr:hypothetical protein [Deltaproteobacteria bacterium]